MAGAAGLQQQDGMFAMLGQPTGDSGAGGARTHHDEVIGGAAARRREEEPRDAPLHHVGQVDVGTRDRVKEAKDEEVTQRRLHADYVRELLVLGRISSFRTFELNELDVEFGIWILYCIYTVNVM